MQINIINFKPRYKSAFNLLNRVWIEKYFEIEPMDEEILQNPDVIIKNGGYILFAEIDKKVIGTVALKYVNNYCFELTKLAVDERHQGLGAGKLLCRAAIEKAWASGAKRIVLSTESRLKAAINIYKNLGFVEVPMTENKYARVDMMMELKLI